MNLPKSLESYTPVNKRVVEMKPNFHEAARRWEAYWNHDIIDRPVLTAAIQNPALNLSQEHPILTESMGI